MTNFICKPLPNSTAVIQLIGNLDDSNQFEFFRYISALLDSGIKHVIIECQTLGQLTSKGFNSLLSARKRAIRNGSKISLTHLNSNVAQILEVTKLGRLLSIFPTTESALEYSKSKLFRFS